MTTTAPTQRKNTFHLTDALGNSRELLTIEGQGLEQYFAGTNLIAPAGDQVAFVDGVIQQDLTAPIKAGESVMIGEAPSNG